ncbi:uncharacterized protein MONBRDRAFT_28191 [Monosiga brevicollis MX1]|uniref:PH domain-containing protein n=1 Tax=Monosiga brevicollis TaxID=81824 RepID=A9V7G7_MONBE|nr:uncharacterized protein MONBRDRAFT_28191 [Monosiga brevicollis MX1]EDQ86510.1 predicted protein [Monosiga brevicollis MX1]|eukprot:XP_001748623.1 hypothetical protein [Monosiga brevicollis MX1]
MAETAPVHEGYLTKLGFNSGKWQQRYFVLKGQALAYLAKPGGTEKGCIPLSASAVLNTFNYGGNIQASGVASGTRVKPFPPGHGLEIVAPFKGHPRAYYLFATTKAERDAWMAALVAAVEASASADPHPEAVAPAAASASPVNDLAPSEEDVQEAPVSSAAENVADAAMENIPDEEASAQDHKQLSEEQAETSEPSPHDTDPASGVVADPAVDADNDAVASQNQTEPDEAPAETGRAMLGVNADFIHQLSALLQKEFGDEYTKMTTTEICVRYVMPLTKERQCAWVDLLVEDPSHAQHFAPATVFVSHAWKYTFQTTLDTILHHEQFEAPGAYYWLDLIPNNQHKAVDLPYEWWSNTFQKNIKAMGRVLLVMSPWRDPIPMTRAWCLFEMMNALNAKVILDIRLHQSQIKDFLDALGEDADVVMDMLVRVHAQKAEAFKLSDRDMIFKTIENTLGFTELNARIKDQLRGWCLEQARVAAKDMDNTTDIEPMSRAAFFLSVGFALAAFGEYDDAIAYYGKALPTYVEELGADADKVADIYNHTGLAHKALTHYDEAMRLYNDALRIKVALHGEDHPQTAALYSNLASVYEALDDYAQAAHAAQRVLDIMLSDANEDRGAVAVAHNNLGMILKTQGRLDEAFQHMKQALDISLVEVGELHPSTATSYNNLGLITSQQGKYAQAVEFYKHALDVRVATLGEQHAETAGILNNLANTYKIMGNFGEAIKYFDRARNSLKAILEPNHPFPAITASNTAGLLQMLGRYDEALDLYNFALDTWLATLGEEHAYTATTYNNMGSVYDATGRYEDALDLYHKALKIRLAVFGEHHHQTGVVYNNMACACSALGRFDEALELYDKDLAIQLATLGPEHPDTATCYNNMGGAHKGLENWDKAAELFAKSLAILEPTLGPQHPNTLGTYDSMSQVCEKLGDPEQAALYRARAQGQSSPPTNPPSAPAASD